MFALSFGIYILLMVFVWGFFLVAKVHFFKFKEYSQYVVPATKLLMITLVFLSALGAYFVFSITGGPTVKTQTVEENQINEVY